MRSKKMTRTKNALHCGIYAYALKKIAYRKLWLLLSSKKKEATLEAKCEKTTRFEKRKSKKVQINNAPKKG